MNLNLVLQVSRDRAADGSETTEYLVKWCCLPYSECTWEESRLLPQEKIDEYHERIENLKSPVKSAQVCFLNIYMMLCSCLGIAPSSEV